MNSKVADVWIAMTPIRCTGRFFLASVRGCSFQAITETAPTGSRTPVNRLPGAVAFSCQCLFSPPPGNGNATINDKLVGYNWLEETCDARDLQLTARNRLFQISHGRKPAPRKWSNSMLPPALCCASPTSGWPHRSICLSKNRARHSNHLDQHPRFFFFLYPPPRQLKPQKVLLGDRHSFQDASNTGVEPVEEGSGAHAPGRSLPRLVHPSHFQADPQQH